MDFLVLQHTPWAEPGRLLWREARRHGLGLRVVRLWQEWIPDFKSCRGIILLGGSHGGEREKRYPFLVEERRYLIRALAADKPILAFSLGHQLLASALGATVGANSRPGIGFVRGHLTHEGREHPAFARLGRKLPLLKWHGQAVLEPLPKHLSLLATSEQCQVEAFSLAGRPHVLGLQCANHAALPEDLACWLERDDQWLASLPSLGARPGDLLAEASRLRKRVGDDFARFFADYLRLVA